ncbi:MAG: ABC transporter permease [Rhodobacterales bacterium]|nr:MAG: ABC transporter permease [Rhodobacterales bacterium]
MAPLDRKLLRDLKRLWPQVLAIAAVMAVGVMVMIMAFGVMRSLTETRDRYYERSRFADIWSNAARAPKSLVPEIAAIEGVSRVEARIVQNAILDLPDLDDPASGQLISVPASGTPSMNVPVIRAGRLPLQGREHEVAIGEAFATAHGFTLGDRFHLTINGQKREVSVVGIVLSPEYIYTIGPGSILPDDLRFGILWMAEDVLAAAYNLSGAFNSVTLGLTRGGDPEVVKDALELLLKPYGGTGPYDRDMQTSHAFLKGELLQLDTMARVVPPIFLVVSAFLVNMVLGRLIALEREQIGLLKALGYRDAEISWHYLKLALGLAAVGVVVGMVAGTASAVGQATMYQEYFKLPYLIAVQEPSVYAIGALAGFGSAFLGALFAVRRVVVLSPAVAMSPPAPTRYRKGALDGLGTLLRLQQPTMMIVRSITRWPIRAALTTLGISLSGGIIIAGLFMFDSFDEVIDVAFVQANRQDAMLEFPLPRPEAVLEDVSNLPGVLAVEGSLNVAARLYAGHYTRTIGIEGRRDDSVLVRVLDGDTTTDVRPEHGIVLARRLADHLRVGVGDTIEVEFLQLGEERHPVVVTGLVTQFFGLGAFMDLEHMSRLMGRAAQVTTANVLYDPAQELALFRAVKDAPAISGIIQMRQIRRGFSDTIETNAGMMVNMFVIMASMIAIGVVYNSARIQLSERARELASLRILGFTRGEVSYILLGELFLLTALSIPLGFVMGYGMAGMMVMSFNSDLYSMPLLVTPTTYWRAAGVVVAASVASALIVRRRIDRMDLVSVMKTRE